MIKKIKKILIVVVITIVIVIIWQYLTSYFEIPKRIIPKPTDLWEFFNKEFLIQHSTNYTTILDKALQSLRDALFGFTISLALGTIIGILLSQSSTLYYILFSMIFLTQLIPVPALAPILAAIFGYGYTTKMILIVLFTIFPVAVTIRTSILNIPENYLQLLSTYTNDKWKVFKYLILPSLVPPLLSTMKILSTASIVATIITELPLSVRNGIGKDIYNSFNNQMIPRVWVSVITISILSLIFFTVLDNLETYLNKKYRYGQY
jgi:ABC-type nitrate/sulfonate/bicarbonate transport system permease component